MARFAFLFIAALIVSGCVTGQREFEPIPTSSEVRDPDRVDLHWEVQNRFRLLDGKDEEERFVEDFVSYADARRVWYGRERGAVFNILNADLNPTRTAWTRPAENYSTRYDESHARYSYASAADDPIRTVTLGLAGVPVNIVCRWQFSTSIDDAPNGPGPCSDLEIRVPTDESISVEVRWVQDGELHHRSTAISIENITLVALGDSYSAGEGNPHAQWRFFTRYRRPATWLDARCHRSLISGPAIAAAYMARKNPHVTVTLLHYGCSGATIADGIVGPSSQLVTGSQLARRYENNRRLFRRIPWFYDAEFMSDLDSRIYADHLVPSQVERARLDLQAAGLEADAIWMSEGGNTIGFAQIATSLIAPFQTPNDLKPNVSVGRISSRNCDQRRYGPVDALQWRNFIPDICGPEHRRSGGDANLQPRFDRETCIDPGSISAFLDCLEGRILARRDNYLTGNPSQSRPSQYAVLNQALRADTGLGTTLLRDGAFTPVVITGYPDPSHRHSDDSRFPPPDPTLTPCVDRPFDGRPGAIPGVVAWVRGLGLTRDASEFVRESVVARLNEGVRSSANAHGWIFADTHLQALEAYGVCSLIYRSSNTPVDSFLNQSSPGQGWEPIGRLQITESLVKTLVDEDEAENGFLTTAELVPFFEDNGDLIADWNIELRCYQPIMFERNGRMHTNENCIDFTDYDVCDEHSQTDECRPMPDPGRTTRGYGGVWLEPDLSDNRRWGMLLSREPDRDSLNNAGPIPTGAVHPTMEGHCAYGHSILSSYVQTLLTSDAARAVAIRDALAEDFVEHFSDQDARLRNDAELAAPYLCTPGAWGYRPKADN